MGTMDINESRRAGARVVWSVVAVAVGVVLPIATFGSYYSKPVTAVILVIFMCAFAGGLAAISVNLITYVRVGRGRRRPLIVRVDSTGGGGKMWVEDGRLTRIGTHSFKQEQWLLLANALVDANWSWSRRKVGRAGIFSSLTKRWPDIDAEVGNLELVDGDGRDRAVTSQGRELICRAAGLDHLI